MDYDFPGLDGKHRRLNDMRATRFARQTSLHDIVARLDPVGEFKVRTPVVTVESVREPGNIQNINDINANIDHLLNILENSEDKPQVAQEMLNMDKSQLPPELIQRLNAFLIGQDTEGMNTYKEDMGLILADNRNETIEQLRQLTAKETQTLFLKNKDLEDLFDGGSEPANYEGYVRSAIAHHHLYDNKYNTRLDQVIKF